MPASWPAKQTSRGAPGRSPRAQRVAHASGNSVPGDHAAVRRSSPTPASSATRSASAATAVAPRLDRLGLRRAGVEPQPRERGDGGRRVRLDHQPRRGERPCRAAARPRRRRARSRARRRRARRGAPRAGSCPAWSARPVSSTCEPHPRGQPRHDAGRRAARPRGRASGRRAARGSRAARSSHSGARAEPGRVDARRGHRVAERRRRASSTRSSASSTSSRPTSAREPNVGVLKRAPSSSANEITASGTRRALGHREAGGDAERAVEAPAAAHAVEVRADRPPRPAARPGTPTGCPPGRAPSAARSPPRRRANQRAACLVLGRPGQPRRAARLVEPDRRSRSASSSASSAAAITRRHPGRAAPSPRPITARTGLRPKRYGTCSTGAVEHDEVGRACRPRSSPSSPDSPSTHAAFSVHAASASRADQP